MKNRKTYELTQINGKYRAAEVGNPDKTHYLSADTEEAALAEVAKMNATYHLEDYSPEEIEEFWNGIDITPVNEYFSKLLNLPVRMEKQSGKNYNGTICYALADKANIAQESCITNAAWKEMNVQSFGCAISAKKETGDLYFWADIHLAYRHWGGGTNGATIGVAWFEDGEWTIKSEEERQKPID